MAYSLGIGDIIQVNFEGRVYGQKTMTIRQYQLTQITVAQFANQDFDEWFNAMTGVGGLITFYRSCCSVDWTMEQIVFQRIRLTRNARYPKAYANPGTRAGQAGTGNVSASIELLTDLSTVRAEKRNTGYVGRCQIPALSQSTYANGLLLAGFNPAITTLASALAAPITGASGNQMSPIIFHRGQPGTVAAATPITGWGVQTTVRTQRTRTVGKGE